MTKSNPLEDAIAASNAASAASKFLSRVLEREKAGKLTPDEVRDQGAEAIAMMLDAAERMRAAVIEFHSGQPRKTGYRGCRSVFWLAALSLNVEAHIVGTDLAGVRNHTSFAMKLIAFRVFPAHFGFAVPNAISFRFFGRDQCRPLEPSIFTMIS
jgi:hypothetical protein